MKCRDFCEAKLNIGDKVVGIVSVYGGFSGIVSNIVETDSTAYISLSDENGNVIGENFEPKYFTTPERLEFSGPLDSDYSISCFDDELYPMFDICLPKQSAFDYDLDGVSVAYLNCNKKEGKGIVVNHLISFRSSEDTELFCYNGYSYIMSSKNRYNMAYVGDNDDIAFDSSEKLHDAIEMIISSFDVLDKRGTLDVDQGKQKNLSINL